MSEPIPQVRMRDGAGAEAATAAEATGVSQGFPAEPIPGERYEIVSGGKTIGIKWWNALERMRFFELVGAQNSVNSGVLSVAIPAYMISDFGEKKFAQRPLSRAQLDVKIISLGDDAISPAWNAMLPMFTPAETPEDQLEEDRQIKNA